MLGLRLHSAEALMSWWLSAMPALLHSCLGGKALQNSWRWASPSCGGLSRAAWEHTAPGSKEQQQVPSSWIYPGRTSQGCSGTGVPALTREEVSAAPRVHTDFINTLRAKEGGRRGRSSQQQQSQALRKKAIIWILDAESGDHLQSKITLASWIKVPE